MTILNIVDCVPRGPSRMENAKYNRLGQTNYNDDARFTYTRNKCSTVVPYVQVSNVIID